MPNRGVSQSRRSNVKLCSKNRDRFVHKLTFDGPKPSSDRLSSAVGLSALQFGVGIERRTSDGCVARGNPVRIRDCPAAVYRNDRR
jgi:hypothetical protein